MNALQRAYEEGVKTAAGKLLTSIGGAGIGGLTGGLSAGEDEDPFLRALIGAGAGAGLGRAGLSAGKALGRGAGKRLLPGWKGSVTGEKVVGPIGALLGIGAGAGGIAAIPGANR